jgi:hypothetical protein
MRLVKWIRLLGYKPAHAPWTPLDQMPSAEHAQKAWDAYAARRNVIFGEPPLVWPVIDTTPAEKLGFEPFNYAERS